MTTDTTVSDPGKLPAWFDTLRESGRQQRLPYEWNSIGLWIRDDGRTSLATQDGFRHLTFPSDDKSRLIHTALGAGDPRALVDILSATDVLERVVGSGLAVKGEPKDIVRIPDTRYSDYVYDLQEQVGLSGKRFARRRTYLRELSGRKHHYRDVDLNLADNSAREEIRTVNARWTADHDPNDRLIAAESAALARLLETAHLMPVIAKGITCDNELVAFSIFDVNGTHATAHFVKSQRDSAVTAFTWQSMFEAAHDLGALTINAGYDGGLAGLRRAKTNLTPCEIIAKETLMLEV